MKWKVAFIENEEGEWVENNICKSANYQFEMTLRKIIKDGTEKYQVYFYGKTIERHYGEWRDQLELQLERLKREINIVCTIEPMSCGVYLRDVCLADAVEVMENMKPIFEELYNEIKSCSI